MKLLGKFISVSEPNIRYLGLMTMAKLAQLDGSSESIKKHQATVRVSLKDADVSVRRRALELLFVMCDTDNAERIVDELVAHLVLTDAAIREEIALKIAILAEEYAADLRCVTNHPHGDLQAYAAATLLVAASPRRYHETAVRVAAYVLGEFGSAGHEIRRVLDEHENMQEIAAREVQQLAHRPHLSPRALYNCIVFLNQLKLRKGGDVAEVGASSESLAVSLVNTYFRMFDVAMKEQSDDKHCTKSRHLSALLTGINRAPSFLPDRDQGLEVHVDSLYNVSHIAAPSASTQALMLLFHVAIGPRGETRPTAAQESKQDRIFRALYAKLSRSSFLGGGKHLTLFFNLIYKTMKNDTNSARLVAFAKKLMSTGLHANPAVATSCLSLLNEVMKTHKCLVSSLNDRPEKESANLRLDPSKREPRAAIVHSESQTFDTAGAILAYWDILPSFASLSSFSCKICCFAWRDRILRRPVA